MTAYGIYVCYLMLRRPEDLAVEENHVSWAHMYRMMFVAQVGFALATCSELISRGHLLKLTLRRRIRASLTWANKRRNSANVDQPLLFDLGNRAPTTRTLALRDPRQGADAALDQAQRRADAARYQEVTCRSALNPVKGMPFNWTLNPYRGCTHACHYCFARRYQTQFELGPGDRVLVGDLRQDQPGRSAAAGARQAVVDARAGGASAPPPIRISRSRATTS